MSGKQTLNPTAKDKRLGVIMSEESGKNYVEYHTRQI